MIVRTSSVVRFTNYLVAILVGLMVLPLRSYNQNRNARDWARVTACSVFPSTIAFFVYQDLIGTYSVNYGERRVVIGSEFTALGRQHKQSFPHLTNQDLVMRSAGQPELVWTKDSIRRRNLLLKAFYVGASVLLAVSLLSVVQAIHCSGLPKRNKDVRAHRS